MLTNRENDDISPNIMMFYMGIGMDIPHEVTLSQYPSHEHENVVPLDKFQWRFMTEFAFTDERL